MLPEILMDFDWLLGYEHVQLVTNEGWRAIYKGVSKRLGHVSLASSVQHHEGLHCTLHSCWSPVCQLGSAKRWVVRILEMQIFKFLLHIRREIVIFLRKHTWFFWFWPYLLPSNSMHVEISSAVYCFNIDFHYLTLKWFLYFLLSDKLKEILKEVEKELEKKEKLQYAARSKTQYYLNDLLGQRQWQFGSLYDSLSKSIIVI